MAASDHYGSTNRLASDNGSALAQQHLPSGSCGFRDLNAGAEAPFQGYDGQHGDLQKAWCFCGHHACFHDAFSKQRSFAQVSMAAPVASPRGVVESSRARQAEVHMSPSRPSGLGIRSGSLPPRQSQSVDTRLWDALNAFAREQEDGLSSDTTSKLPSTACPSVAGEQPRPVGLSRMLLEQRAQHSRSMGPPVNIPYGYQLTGGVEEYSATEVATPSARGTPDLRAFAPPTLQSAGVEPGISVARSSPNVPASANLELPRLHHLPAVGAATVEAPMMIAAVDSHQLEDLFRSLSRRVELLENLSFSHVPVEAVEEKFELMDGRLLDLEQWREHSEAAPDHAGPSNAKRRRLLPAETDSFSSEDSFDSAAAAHTEAVVLATLAANSETGPRIDALERRIVDLEHATLPSFTTPWHVQAVLLPWGRALPGVWFSALDATQHSQRYSTQASEDWTGVRPPPKLSFQASSSGAWTTESIEAWADDAHGWMSPKACGPSGMVFQRLASRGLVQDVVLTSPDSRHLLAALSTAFGPILASDTALSSSDHEFQALSERIIPLRKIRKSSRLRFLSPAEMITSATWSAGFIDCSVCMKVNGGQRRLYVTTPDAYVQADREGWSWSTLKGLPLFEASSEEQSACATGSAIEACWAYNQSLDQPVSTAASFAASQGSALFSDQQYHFRSDEGMDENAESGSRPLVLPLGTLAKRQRTVSLPSSSSAAEQHRVVLPKRRVASFEISGSLRQHRQADAATSKRRRVSSSPEAERRGVGLTPRMSREPSELEVQSQENVSRKRGMTPFAYATPHSNSNAGYARMNCSIEDGDTEADTDLAVPEDEWQGVGDDLGPEPVGYGSAVDELGMDEEDLQEVATA
ncbi:hypothetical protein LTR53_009500 [Teratosphaeriaceae sp. CCFEE 6253]|nr:hypothetical protein LTR53_009500 [Teratosphaeriaceae sp. CCFEE 6253]